MRKSDLPSQEPFFRSHALNPLVALLAHPDEKAASHFREVFEDVACDWRLVRVGDGTAAARHVMNKGLPELLVLSAELPPVSGPDLVEWLRSFRGAHPIPILVYGTPAEETQAQFLRHDVKLMVPTPCSRQTLAAHLTPLISQVEKRRFSAPA